MDSKCHFGNKRGQVSIVGMKLSHRNLDPLGRKKGGGGQPSLVTRVFHHFQLSFVIVLCCSLSFHTSPRRCVGLLLMLKVSFFVVVELMVRTTQSAEARVSCSEVRG